MSKLLRMPLALLTASAMLTLWAAPASADDPAPTKAFTDCQAVEGASTQECLTELGGISGLVEGQGGPASARQSTPPRTTEAPSGSSSVPSPQALNREDPVTSQVEPPAGGDTTPPNPTTAFGCVSAEILELLEVLQGSVDEFADDLLTTLQSLIKPEVLLNPTTGPAALAALIAGLPKLVTDTVPQLGTTLGSALPGALLGLGECLRSLMPEPEKPAATPKPSPTPAPAQQPTTVSYANCDEARAAGAAPIQSGTPGYAAHLDSDNDGVGCEQEAAVPVSHTTTKAPQLAYTGFDAGPLVAGGAAMVALGTLTVLAAARRES